MSSAINNLNVAGVFDRAERIVRFCHHLVPSRAEREDLRQGIALLLLQRVRDGHEDTLGYLVCRARSLLRDLRRHTHWESRSGPVAGPRVDGDEDGNLPPSIEIAPAPDPKADDFLHSREVVAQVLEAVMELPIRRRTAIQLCCLEGLPRTECARRMAIAVGTFDQTLCAARRQLSDRLPEILRR